MTMKQFWNTRLMIGTLAAAVLGGVPGEVMAVVPAKVVTETMEFLVKRYGDDVLREGTETVAEQVTKIAATYGDEGLDAVRRVGPRGIKVIQEAGENGLDAVKLINRYGDEAVWVISKPKGMAIFVKYGDDGARALMKHKGIAEEVIDAHGKSAVGALNAVGTREARQIAMLQKDGVIRAGEQGNELLDVIIRYGDKAMAFIWRNKGALAVGAGLGTFIANPEAYIEGGKELIVEGVSRPASEMGKEVARNTNWTVLGIAGIGMLGLLQVVRMWMRRPKVDPHATATSGP
jgi:hypothetical protein